MLKIKDPIEVKNSGTHVGCCCGIEKRTRELWGMLAPSDYNRDYKKENDKPKNFIILDQGMAKDPESF